MLPKKILFPTDFSNNAYNSLPFVKEVAFRAGAQVYVLNVFHYRQLDPDIPPSQFQEKAREKQKEAEEKLQNLCREVTSEDKVKTCGYEVRVGFADDEILECIKEQEIDLVVMGTRGASNLSKLILGSTTSEVICDAQCPVLAIPSEATFKGFSKIIFATDLNHNDIPLIQKASEFAELFDAQLSVVFVQENKMAGINNKIEAFRKDLKDKVPYKHLYFESYHYKKKMEGIDAVLNEKGANLLAMVAYKRTLFSSLFKQSFTSRMAHQSKIPLLAFHEKHKQK